MKKILLLSNEVFHYREKIYNYFSERFLEDRYDFYVASDKFQDKHTHVFNEYRLDALSDWRKAIDAIKPEIVITFLHLKDRIFLKLIRYCKQSGIKVVYWGTGVSWTDPNNPLKNAYYRIIQSRCDALITYSPDATRFFADRFHEKLFIAPNTLNLLDIDKNKYSRDIARSKYGIKQKHIVLMMTRMTKYRQPHLLVEALANVENAAVVLVGPGADNDLVDLVNSTSNAYYLGSRYGDEACELYSAADIYSSPQTIGLGLNEAFFWGLPVVVMSGGFHGAETYYLKDGKTGFVAKDKDDYRQKLSELVSNVPLRSNMSKQCEETYENEMSVSRMYDGFLEAITYVGC